MQCTRLVTAGLVSLRLGLGLGFGVVRGDDEEEIKFEQAPPAVKKTFEAETKGVKIATLSKEKGDEDETVYWADVMLAGKMYAIGVLEDGTLSEMNLAVEDDEVPFERCPAAVQATLHAESFGARVETVGKDMKYGVPIYETVVEHKGKEYQLVVAEDGTLVEKVLVIDDEDVELATCPAMVQIALREHAAGGKIGDITRSTGIGRHTYEAEVEIRGKIYLIEVSETGMLIAKSLEAAED